MICRGVYPQQKIEKTGIGGRKTGGKKMYDKESRERKFMEFLQVPHIKTILSKV
jgi:hypothetical protein